MTYPQHPGPPGPGQQPPYPAPSGGFPGQPSYPGGYPQAPYPAPGYGMRPAKPSGVTAIIAGVLAVLGGLLYLVGLIGSVVTLASIGLFHWLFLLAMARDVLIAGTLLPGGILLFLRKPTGRVLTIIGSGLAILLAFVSVVLDALGVWRFAAGIGEWYLGGPIVALLMVLIPAGATLVLAIVKPTARWCERAAPAVAGYPPR